MVFSNSQLNVVSPIPHVAWCTFIHILQFCIYLALLGLKKLLTGGDLIGVDVPSGWSSGVGVPVLDFARRLRGGLTVMDVDDEPPRPTAGVHGFLLVVLGAINIRNIVNFIFILLLNCGIHSPRHCRMAWPVRLHL